MKIKSLFPFLLVLIASAWIVSPAFADEIALAQTVQAGQTAEFTFGVRNDTADENQYTLTLTGLPEDMAVNFSLNGPLIESISVPPQDTVQVRLRVEVPADTPVGHYSGQISAVRDDGQAIGIPLSLSVENTYALNVVSQSLNLTSFSGKEFSFDVTGANSGAAPVTNVTLIVNAPPKWNVSMDPSSLSSMGPGAEAIFHVRVLVPASQAPQDQTLSLALLSDQTASPERSLTVRVQKSPTFFYAALGLMALAVGGVLIYFRSRGRR